MKKRKEPSERDAVRSEPEKASPGEDHLMTIKEVAEYLSVHEMTLYALIHETDLPAMKLGGQWRFKRTLLDEWLTKEMNHKRLGHDSPHDHPGGHGQTGTHG